MKTPHIHPVTIGISPYKEITEHLTREAKQNMEIRRNWHLFNALLISTSTTKGK